MDHVYVEALLKGVKAERGARTFVDTGSTFSIIPYEMAEDIGVYKARGKRKFPWPMEALRSLRLPSLCWRS
jgi:hypothetical protein